MDLQFKLLIMELDELLGRYFRGDQRYYYFYSLYEKQYQG